MIERNNYPSCVAPSAISEEDRQARQEAKQEYKATAGCKAARQSSFSGTANYSCPQCCRSVTKEMTLEKQSSLEARACLSQHGVSVRKHHPGSRSGQSYLSVPFFFLGERIGASGMCRAGRKTLHPRGPNASRNSVH